MKNKRAQRHAGSNRRGRDGAISSPGGIGGAGRKRRGGGGGGGSNGGWHSGGHGRQGFGPSSPLSAGRKRHKVARQGGGVGGWVAGESTFKHTNADRNKTSYKDDDAMQRNGSALEAGGGDFGGGGGAIHHVNSMRQRQQRRYSVGDQRAELQASANANNEAGVVAGLSAQKPNRHVDAEGATDNGLVLGARESLALAFNAAQQPRRRRIDFHSPRRPQSAGAAPTATPLARSALGGANKAVNPIQAGAGKAGGKDREGQKESGLERCNRLAEKAIGLPHAEKGLFPESSVKASLTWKAVTRVGPGLHNLGNTCFLNATLQCLSYLPPLAQHLLDTSYSPLFPAGPGGSPRSPGMMGAREFRRLDIMLAMQKLTREVHCAKGNTQRGIRPVSLAQNISSIGRSFRLGRQEDAHEFLRHLLDKMVDGCLKRRSVKPSAPGRLAETTAINRIFGGYLRSQLKCVSCGYCSDTYDPFLDLSMELSGGVHSLKQALQHFTAKETLDVGNRWKCAGCEKLVRAEKRLTVYKPSNALVIHLKRFVMTPRGRAMKLKQHVPFTDELQLEVSGPERSAKYSLTGVVVHQGGSVSSGHYYAYVRSAAGQWQKMDDQCVTTVQRQTVLKDKGYLLFFTRQPHVFAIPRPPPLSALAKLAVSAAVKRPTAVGAAAAVAGASKEPIVSSPKDMISISGGGDVSQKWPVGNAKGTGFTGGEMEGAETGGLTSRALSFLAPVGGDKDRASGGGAGGGKKDKETEKTATCGGLSTDVLATAVARANSGGAPATQGGEKTITNSSSDNSFKSRQTSASPSVGGSHAVGSPLATSKMITASGGDKNPDPATPATRTGVTHQVKSPAAGAAVTPTGGSGGDGGKQVPAGGISGGGPILTDRKMSRKRQRKMEQAAAAAVAAAAAAAAAERRLEDCEPDGSVRKKRKRGNNVSEDAVGLSASPDAIPGSSGGEKVCVVGAGNEQSASAVGSEKRDGHDDGGDGASGDGRKADGSQLSKKANRKRRRKQAMAEEEDKMQQSDVGVAGKMMDESGTSAGDGDGSLDATDGVDGGVDGEEEGAKLQGSNQDTPEMKDKEKSKKAVLGAGAESADGGDGNVQTSFIAGEGGTTPKKKRRRKKKKARSVHKDCSSSSNGHIQGQQQQQEQEQHEQHEQHETQHDERVTQHEQRHETQQQQTSTPDESSSAGGRGAEDEADTGCGNIFSRLASPVPPAENVEVAAAATDGAKDGVGRFRASSGPEVTGNKVTVPWRHAKRKKQDLFGTGVGFWGDGKDDDAVGDNSHSDGHVNHKAVHEMSSAKEQQVGLLRARALEEGQNKSSRANSFWDRSLDMGKLKKVKAKKEPMTPHTEKNNPFETRQQKMHGQSRRGHSEKSPHETDSPGANGAGGGRRGSWAGSVKGSAQGKGGDRGGIRRRGGGQGEGRRGRKR